MTLFVGVHEDTNANAAVVAADGQIVAAAAEERFSRHKYGGGFPSEALRWATAAAGADLHDPDVRLVAANPYHPLPRLLAGRLPGGPRDFLGPVQVAHLAWHELLFRSSGARWIARGVSRRGLTRSLGDAFEFVGHHAAHAASAYFTCPWNRATVVTCDNMGDGESARVFSGADGRLEPLWAVGAWDSPGQFYGEIAAVLGIDPMTAGKVTGLAARGNPDAAAALLSRYLAPTPDRRGFSRRRLSARARRRLQGFGAADLAAGGQRCLEDALLPFVSEAVRTTGCGHVALAGGVFANVTLNRRILELPEVESLWVHPAMSDQGIAVGAALLAAARRGPLRPRPMEHVFLGPSWSERECATAIREAGLEPVRPDDLAEAVAALLADSRVVARFDGPMEYGPRALGNRSILARPDDPSINDWLNERLDRSEYMPFAPVTLASHAARLYEGLEAAAPSVPFMTIALPVKEPHPPGHGAVIHVDGTARPQVLTEAGNPGLHAILSSFCRRTGLPSLVNTSFNLHGEPIVCTPEEAIRTFRAARLDALALGPFLVRR